MGADVYQMVTDRIVAELENGVIPWQKGWGGVCDGAYNYKTKHVYSFLNQILLKHSDAYLTFKQIKEMGGKVNKGAKAEFVVFWKIYKKEDPDDKDKPITIPVLRYYNVFWIGDTDIKREESFSPTPIDPIQEAEDIISEYLKREDTLEFVNDSPSNRAYFSPISDRVVVPMLTQFSNVEEYYSTAFHELTHSTGIEKRLNRMKTGQLAAFGDENYSKEELVAELGSAMLVNHCGIETEKSFKNSVAYIQSWLRALRNDKRLIVSAAGKAEKAAKYILSGEKTA